MTPDLTTTTVSTKGQVILPKVMRDQLHWEAGTRLSVQRMDDGMFLRNLAAVFAPTRADDVFGCLPVTGPARTIEEMDAGIAAEARRRHARGRY